MDASLKTKHKGKTRTKTASGARKYKFSGHQTFVFRHGWLEKGVRAVEDCPTALLDEDALVRLGVGKNMVESIKHWCIVTQMIEECRIEGKQAHRPTTNGRKLLLELDPFLEDDASLWLIHWLLATNPRLGTTCQLVFGEFLRPDFSKRELVDYLMTFANKHSISIKEGSLVRDIDCFVRTYALSTEIANQGLAEDSFDCPLLALNLIQISADGDLYRFAIGPKPSLPAPIVAFAMNEYFERTRGGVNTMGVQECLYGANSPGQVFKLDENSLLEYVEQISKVTRDCLLLDETAGLKQIYRDRPIDVYRLLNRYYGAEERA